MFCTTFKYFPIGIPGQVWYLIVSIPDLCTLTYFNQLKANNVCAISLKCLSIIYNSFSRYK